MFVCVSAGIGRVWGEPGRKGSMGRGYEGGPGGIYIEVSMLSWRSVPSRGRGCRPWFGTFEGPGGTCGKALGCGRIRRMPSSFLLLLLVVVVVSCV